MKCRNNNQYDKRTLPIMNAPTPSNTLYRFRSIDALLDKYHELEKQAIYFANPDELNDPMEGFRDIVWSGDEIVWEKFFKHYIYCLHVATPYSIASGYSSEFNARKISITGRWDLLPSGLKSSFDDIWRRFLELPQVPEVITALSNTNRKIRYREIEIYLQVIRLTYIILYLQSFSEYSLSTGATFRDVAGGVIDEISEELEKILGIIPTCIAQFDTPETERGFDDVVRKVEDELRETETKADFQMNINRIQNLTPTGQLAINDQSTSLDFPKMYLQKIERLLWPEWYVACFMKDCRNSSVWGHYGNGHTGVCLIFEPATLDESSNGLFPPREAVTAKAIQGFDIRYAAKPAEINFFRSLAPNVSTVAKLMQLWYTDDQGNTSGCASHIQPSGVEDEWYERIWDQFYDGITIKTKDWKYEQEYRLILRRIPGHYNDKESRTLRYEFNSLKGIIFGIKTSNEDKLRIIDIIQAKCKKYKRSDFKFYQAYYSHETGDICKFEI